MIVVSPHTSASFQKLFSINMLHEFYGDKRPRQLHIVPTEECRQTMRNYKLIFKPQEAGCLVLTRSDEMGKMLFKSNDDLKLSFAIQSADPFFINYTNLPLTSTKNIYYFNNMEANVNEENQKLIHKETFVYDKDEIVARHPYFNHKFKEPISTNKLWIEDMEGNKVWAKDIEVEELSSYPINLRYEELGKYTLKGDGGYVFDFYTTMVNPELYVGFIDICLTDSVTADYQPFQNEEVAAQDYVIHFNSRSTRWKYFFLSKDKSRQNEEYTVASLKKEVSFLEAEEVTLVNGMAAKMIVSEEAIPLKEHPIDKFQLQMKKNGKGVVITVNLPTPSVQSIKPQSTKDNQKIFSEVYVSI
ncbi:MAG: hypothetical protein ACPGVB_00215 [Chitinophagales bacterium]